MNIKPVRLATVLALAGCIALAGPAVSAADGKPVKSGTVKIEQMSVALMWSASLGGGTLNYKGKTYEFTIGGIGVGGIGASTLTASGTVYDLKKLSDFEGVYGQVRTGHAVGDEGKGMLSLENPAGVVLSLRAKREGLALTMGADGVVVKLK